MPAAISRPPANWSRVRLSCSKSSAMTAARNGWRFANSEAREGPTRSIAVNQSRFVITSGPITA